jgi:hypothetical protein
MMLWFKSEKLKDSQELKKTKSDIINSIINTEPQQVRNTVNEKKSYTLWERIKRVLWTN